MIHGAMCVFVYVLLFPYQVGALFSLSCIITPIAQPAASQLSSQRWRESIARRPKSIPGKTVLIHLSLLHVFVLPFHHLCDCYRARSPSVGS